MALKDILSNAKYADDMVLNLPDGSTVNVGEIRALPAAERAALTSQIEQRQSTLGQAELAFAAKFQEAVQAGWVAQDGKIIPPVQRQQQQQQAQPTPAQIRAAAAAEFNLDENDPLLGPVVKLVKAELAARDATIAELRAEQGKFPGALDA